MEVVALVVDVVPAVAIPALVVFSRVSRGRSLMFLTRRFDSYLMMFLSFDKNPDCFGEYSNGMRTTEYVEFRKDVNMDARENEMLWHRTFTLASHTLLTGTDGRQQIALNDER